jgi:hypothetical protein
MADGVSQVSEFSRIQTVRRRQKDDGDEEEEEDLSCAMCFFVAMTAAQQKTSLLAYNGCRSFAG